MFRFLLLTDYLINHADIYPIFIIGFLLTYFLIAKPIIKRLNVLIEQLDDLIRKR